MTYKKLLTFFLFLFLLSSFVLAQPPFQETKSGGLTILYPKDNSVQKGISEKINFHIHNSTNGVVNISFVNCYIHVYDINGDHIEESELLKDSNYIDLEFTLNTTHTNTLGFHTLLVWCNSSTNEYGYLSEYYIVTNSGEYDEGSGYKWIAIMIALIGMTALLGFGAGIIKEPSLKPTKTLLFFLFIINIFILGIVAWIISVNPFDVQSFSNLGIGYASINVLLIMAFTWNYVYTRLFKSIKKGLKQRRGSFDKYSEAKK